ncbi:hypothetical protein AAKU67_004130, partial [Oxalobacteraceae bacterium GrIS 2.11]
RFLLSLICCHPFQDNSLNYPAVTVSNPGTTITTTSQYVGAVFDLREASIIYLKIKWLHANACNHFFLFCWLWGGGGTLFKNKSCVAQEIGEYIFDKVSNVEVQSSSRNIYDGQQKTSIYLKS